MQGRPCTGPMPVTIPARRGVAVVQALGRQRGELEERRAVIDQPLDPLACEQLAALAVPLDRLAAAARLGAGQPLAKPTDELAHVGSVVDDRHRNGCRGA